MPASGFFPNTVVGGLRAPGQGLSWNNNAVNPFGWRHIESGVYKPEAKIGNVGGFKAQKESGVPLNFGDIYADNAGFYSDTVVLTFNLGEVNSNPDSYFNLMTDVGQNFKAFNIKLWLLSSGAFAGYKPTFYYRQYNIWQSGLQIRSTTPGVNVLPLVLPSSQNIFSKGVFNFVSGCYKETELTNFVYMSAKFPSGNYQLGTYGIRALKDFVFRISYDWTNIDANTLDTDF